MVDGECVVTGDRTMEKKNGEGRRVVADGERPKLTVLVKMRQLCCGLFGRAPHI